MSYPSTTTTPEEIAEMGKSILGSFDEIQYKMMYSPMHDHYGRNGTDEFLKLYNKVEQLKKEMQRMINKDIAAAKKQ